MKSNQSLQNTQNLQEAGECCDLTVVTGKDWKYHDGHRIVMAAVSPVFAQCPEADLLVLSDWTSNDYCIFLEMAYRGERCDIVRWAL